MFFTPLIVSLLWLAGPTTPNALYQSPSAYRLALVRRIAIPTPTPTPLPVHSIVTFTGSGEVYYYNGTLHYFTSYDSLNAWCSRPAFCERPCNVDPRQLPDIDYGQPLFYPHGSVVTSDNIQLWWIEQTWLWPHIITTKRLIPPHITLQQLGVRPADVLTIDDGELQLIPTGLPLP